eukprot:521804_1
MSFTKYLSLIVAVFAISRCNSQCNGVQYSCNNDGDCCDGLNCNTQQNLCYDPYNCAEDGRSCGGAGVCCENRACNGGVCGQSGICLGYDEPCTLNSDCCSGYCKFYMWIPPIPAPYSRCRYSR